MKQLFFLILLLIAGEAYSAIRYVTPSGAGATNGTSWANAFAGNSLQAAINASTSGDEVWVASGTYYTTTGTDRAISFSMKNGVSIYGSFAGNEIMLSQRILTAGLTSILSAEIGTAGISDNSYHTIHNTGLNTSAVIDGFIVRDANDDRTPLTDEGLGGGIYNDGSYSPNTCSPTIRNCIITNNQAVFGAGIFNSGYLGGESSPVITNCVIVSNHATTGGGGIDNFGLGGNASPVITNTVVYANTATQRAGGMYCWGGNNGNASPVVLNSIFANNMAVDGGAIVCDNLNSSSGNSGNSDPSFRNCIFHNNSVSGTGPQFFILGGATFNATYTAIDLTGQTTPHILSGAGTGNIGSDPLFVNAASGAGVDGNWMTADDGLQLQSTSPCIDAGSNAGVPSTDLLSASRIINTTVDMGAYEFDMFTSQGETPGLYPPLVLYPNPTAGHISFTGLQDLKGRIKLINSQGTVVKNMDSHAGALNISDLSAGIYTVILERDDQPVVQQRVIKE